MRFPMPRGALTLLLAFLPAVAFADRVTVMVELQSPPAIESYLQTLNAPGRQPASSLRAATTAARTELAVVEGEQQSMRRNLAALDAGASVLYGVQRLFNGVAIDVDASRLDDIAKLPGVKRVVPIHLATLDNTSSVPLIGAPDVWKAVVGHATGKNIKIGVIDSGIDYIHRDFGGTGDYTGLFDNDVNVLWTQKVVGGTDMAGDHYDASSADLNVRIPVPDPNPMDCAGHGSHVAGTIAGYGVLKDGTVYVGKYDSIDESQFSIGPGVAPAAKLYAIRIFGCSGSSALVTEALEWALDPNQDGDFSDRMDVVNLSLGSPFGGRTDPDTVAANNLAKAGTVVVASAGNNGDTYFIGGSPASGDRVISVASSVDALEPADGLRLESPDSLAGVYVAHHSVVFNWLSSRPITGSVVYPATQRSGCGGAFNDLNASTLRGNIALLDWTDNECTSTERALNAYSVGAIGVIFRYPRPALDISIAGSSFIPSTIVSSDTGDSIIANLDRGVVATLSPDLLGTEAVITNANIDTLSSFSSRGPRIDDHAIKPEITAPGQSIYSVRARSGNRGVSMSGTSMAAPHVTGVMGLLKELHPDWSVEELKALAMNTATHDLFTGPSLSGPRYGVLRIGAGRIDAARAAQSKAVAFNAVGAGLVGVSFGAFEVATTTARDNDIVVENKSPNPITYDLDYDAVVDQPGVTFSFPHGSKVTVPANGAATFQLRVEANAPVMRHRRDASLTTQQNAVTRHWLGEASGYVRLTSSGVETLRVPVLAVPRATSAMHAESVVPAATEMTIHLAGQTVATGMGSVEDENAVVSAFELVDQSSRLLALAGTPWLDLQYAGIATDAAAIRRDGKRLADATIYFAVTTYGNWSSPLQPQIRIDVDTNNDGIDDTKLTLGNLANFNDPSASASDVFVSIACTQKDTLCRERVVNGVDASILDTVPFNTNVIVLPVRAGDLGLSDAVTRFTYRIRLGNPPTTDQTPRLTYDLANPGLSFSSPMRLPFGFADVPGNTIVAAFDGAAFHRAASRGILLLHHHNSSGRREEVVLINEGKHRAAGK